RPLLARDPPRLRPRPGLAAARDRAPGGARRVTIGEALASFEHGWVETQAGKPPAAHPPAPPPPAVLLPREGRSTDDDLATLQPGDLEAFVRWHAASGLVDDAEASRKVALHVARLGAGLAESCDRPDLALDRDRLRALV